MDLFKKLLKTDWESKYVEYIENLPFTSNKLKKQLIEILKCSDAVEREKKWNEMRITLSEMQEIYKISNPYFIGFGNPNSDILFIGKEKGFDIVKHPELLMKESVNNILQWKCIVNEPNKTQAEYYNNLGFNPMFPRLHNYNTIFRGGHTWALYSKVIVGTNHNSEWRQLFYETQIFDTSIFNHCFMTEVNHIPSKYSTGENYLIDKRREFLQQAFFKKFSKIIIAAHNYLSDEEISEIFGLNNTPEEVELGENNRNTFMARCWRINGKIIIRTNQLSGLAGWTDVALNNLRTILYHTS